MEDPIVISSEIVELIIEKYNYKVKFFTKKSAYYTKKSSQAINGLST